MVLVMVPDIANHFWSEIIRAVQDRLEPEGYSVVIGSTDWSETREDQYYELARSSRFDGLILNSVTDNIDLIKDLGVPGVLIGERAAAQDIDTVGTDTIQATRLAMGEKPPREEPAAIIQGFTNAIYKALLWTDTHDADQIADIMSGKPPRPPKSSASHGGSGGSASNDGTQAADWYERAALTGLAFPGHFQL